MVDFCHRYQIVLGHSTAYYPQGNGLAESSNKSLVTIIKKLLEENKNSWHNKLVHALWANRLTTKKSIGMSPYQLVYGMEAVFPTSLGIPVIKLFQEIQTEEDSMVRRINQTIHLQQTREEVYSRAVKVQENIKKLFDKITKASNFKIGDKVLKWNSRREDKGKHNKFDSLWEGLYIIQSTIGPNAFFYKSLMAQICSGVLLMAGCSSITMANFQFIVFISIVNTIALFVFKKNRKCIKKQRERRGSEMLKI